MSDNRIFNWRFTGAGILKKAVTGKNGQGLVCSFEKESVKSCD